MRMLTRVSPAPDLETVHGRLDRLFGDFLNAPLLGTAGGTATFRPRLDAYETPEAIVVTLEIPGVDPATLEISAGGEELRIQGTKPGHDLPDGTRWMHAETLSGAFTRTLPLPAAVDADAVTAEARHGLLTIRLPKRAEVLPKRIEVTVAS